MMTGATVYEGSKIFWTLSLWPDQKAMQGYMGVGAHIRAMPRLREWCDEAVSMHVETTLSDLPPLSEAYRLLSVSPKFVHVLNPSLAQSEKVLRPPRKKAFVLLFKKSTERR